LSSAASALAGPSAADDGDALVPVLHRPPDRLPHLRLAPRLVLAVLLELAQCRHRVGDRRERLLAAPVLDHVLPEPLGVAVAGGLGQPSDRVAADGVRCRPFVRRGKDVRERQIDHAERRLVRERVADGLPLRREAGEGIEDGTPGLVGCVGEQGDRRPHLPVGCERQERLGLGRSLDEHGVGLQVAERLLDAPRRARAVMTDAEDADAHRSRSRQER
jgi:hypothetical protein